MRIGPCDVCRGSRTVSLPLHSSLAADFDPNVCPNDDFKLTQPNGEMRRYPCPECTKPRIPPDNRGYSTIHVNKLVNEKLKDNAPYMESTRGNVAALIGRTLLTNGLIELTQYRAPPGPEGYDNVIVEGIVSVVHPPGEEIDSLIQDLDPRADPYQKPRQRIPAPWESPATEAKPNRPRNNRELIFEDEVLPNEES